MFVVILTYTADLETIDSLISEHGAWLDANYAAGIFVASGRRVPRTGGVILADVGSRAQLDAVLKQDPFGVAGAATYEVVEFVPTKTAPALTYLQRTSSFPQAKLCALVSWPECRYSTATGLSSHRPLPPVPRSVKAMPSCRW